MQEMIVIFLIILLLFGAKKIPELARGIGKGMGEFKKAKTDFEDEIKRGEVQGEEDWDSDSKTVSKSDAKKPDEKVVDTAKSSNIDTTKTGDVDTVESATTESTDKPA